MGKSCNAPFCLHHVDKRSFRSACSYNSFFFGVHSQSRTVCNFCVQKFKMFFPNLFSFYIFAVIPHRCLHNCSCHFSLENLENIFNCSNKKLTNLPDSIENRTNWFLVKGNNLGHVTGARTYLSGLTLLDMSSSNIVRIDKDTVNEITKNIKYLNIAYNKLQYLPNGATRH